MFHLEAEIAKWKLAILQTGSIAGQEMEELESHLRESTIGLEKKGLTDEEAFYVATMRLGASPKLAAEYDKNRLFGFTSKPLIWMLSGYLLFSFYGLCATVLASVLSTGLTYIGAGATMTGITTVIAQFAFWTFLFLRVVFAKDATYLLGRLPAPSLGVMLLASLIMSFVFLFSLIAQRIVVSDIYWLAEIHRWREGGYYLVQMLLYIFCFVALRKAYRSQAVLASN